MSSMCTRRICSWGLLVALGATAACQSSSGSKAGGGAAAGNSSATTAAAVTTAVGDASSGGGGAVGGGAGGGGGLTGVDAKYCAAIKVADAQDLTTATLSAAKTGGPLSCAFVLPGQDLGGDNITVTVFQNDGGKKFYDDTVKNQLPSGGTPLSGVGDEAAWGQPVAGESGPVVAAHKGSISCVVALPADLTTITIDKTGGGPIFNVTAEAAASFAAKMGVLCNDMFSAGT